MNGQMDEGKKEGKKGKGERKIETEMRVGQRKAERVGVHSEKSVRETEESRWRMKFW